MIGGIGRHTYLMYSKLNTADYLFFSPAENDLPRHVHIKFWPIRFLKQAGVSIWLRLNAARIVSQYRLDKLNIHTGPGGVLFTGRLPVPVVVTCHHTYCQQYRHLKSQFWKRIFFPFEKKTYQLADSIIAVSDATRRALIEDYGIAAEKIVRLCNAIDAADFHPTGTGKSPHTIVYVGRIAKRKGIDFLIESMPLVKERIPDVVLLVAGKGSYLEPMRALVRRLKLEENVRFLGFVPEEQLNDLYNQGECVVVPSVFEGFGITVIEALAAGTRVIGTDSDGIREILQSGDYGRLVPYGDLRALAAAIVAELQAPAQAAPLRPEYLTPSFAGEYRRLLEGAASA